MTFLLPSSQQNPHHSPVDGTRAANYPRQHRENLVTKNQATGEMFKHIVRIFRNARQKLIAKGALQAGIAASSSLEGLQLPGITYVPLKARTGDFMDLHCSL